MVLAIVVQRKLKALQVDVQSAFLNGALEEELYVAQPEGFVKDGMKNKVIRLHKALYGLIPAAKACDKFMIKVLGALGFRRSFNDESPFIRDNCNGDLTIIVSFVYDMLLVGSSLDELHKIARQME